MRRRAERSPMYHQSLTQRHGRTITMVVVNVKHGDFRPGCRWRPHSTCGLLLVRLDSDGDIVHVAVSAAERRCGVMTWWTAEECNAAREQGQRLAHSRVPQFGERKSVEAWPPLLTARGAKGTTKASRASPKREHAPRQGILPHEFHSAQRQSRRGQGAEVGIYSRIVA